MNESASQLHTDNHSTQVISLFVNEAVDRIICYKSEPGCELLTHLRECM